MLKTLSSKGQLVLPARYRRRLGLEVGSQVKVIEDGDRLIIEPTQTTEVKFVSLPGAPKPVLSIGPNRLISKHDLIDPLSNDD